MVMNTPTPLEQAKAILGEHYRNYVIIVQPENEPSNYELTYSCPFATKALLELSNKYQTTYLEGGETDEEWVWEEIDDENDEWEMD